MKRANLIILAIIIITTACNNEAPDFKQKVLFEVHYTNWAWGYQNHGFLVDSMGYARAFDVARKTATWNNTDSLGYISKEKMDENLSLCDSVICQINADTLAHYVGKIWAASKGKISEPEMQMADFGEIRYSAYIFDEKTNRYKEVLIKLYGDQMQNNNTREATDMYMWLNRIGNR